MALFGTDGVRGIANKELTPEIALKLGRAGADVLGKKQGKKCLLVGRDTRVSGSMLEEVLAAGICSAGVNVLKVGVMTTPGIAYLARELEVDGGVVISASHNPVQDNGIKFFGPGGYKLSDQVESEIEEKTLAKNDPAGVPVGAEVGEIEILEDADDRYVQFLKGAVSLYLNNLKIVLDCANGAAYKLAPRVFKELGAEVVPIFNSPDGININENCGSTRPQVLQDAVLEHGAHAGLAFDGDADRVIAVDEKGQLVDGDRIMVICAKYLQAAGMLAQNKIVVTVMSNMGLHLALQESGIEISETKVGDRYVMEELQRTGARFGGEQSGHIIFLDHGATGDGLLTALYLLKVVQESGTPLSSLAARMEKLPQILENVKVKDKEYVMNSAALSRAVKAVEESLQGRGRVLVRPSGTESLVRVMAEGRDIEELRALIKELVEVVHEVES